MTGDEIRLRDQIAGLDRLGTEAQMRDSHRAGFLGVVHEISLRVVVGVFSDDLDGVLVCADGAVGTESVEERADYAVRFG